MNRSRKCGFLAVFFLAFLDLPVVASDLDLTQRFLLLAATKTSTMQKELNDAAARGFRLLPQSIVAKQPVFGATEIVLLMEKPPVSPGEFKYLLLATSRTSTMQREMSEAIDQGYRVIGMVSRGEHIVILEQEPK